MKPIPNPWRDHPEYRCFGCAPSNPAGLHLEFAEDGDEVVCQWRPDALHEGWFDTLHGGIQATLVDETCSWLAMHRARTCPLTTELSLRFLKKVPSSDPLLTVRARAAGRDGNRFRVHAVILRADGEICTEGDATFYLLDPARAAERGFILPAFSPEADAPPPNVDAPSAD